MDPSPDPPAHWYSGSLPAQHLLREQSHHKRSTQIMLRALSRTLLAAGRERQADSQKNSEIKNMVLITISHPQQPNCPRPGNRTKFFHPTHRDVASPRNLGSGPVRAGTTASDYSKYTERVYLQNLCLRPQEMQTQHMRKRDRRSDGHRDVNGGKAG